MTLLVACLATAFGPNLSIVSRGETVSALLKEAGRQSGTFMDAAPQTKDEIVIVSVKDSSVEDFRSHLATAIGATWAQEGNGWRLVRPRSLEKSQEDAERALRLADAKAGIEKLKAKVAAQPAFDAQTAGKLAHKVSLLHEKYKGHLSDGPGLNESIALEPESPAGRLSIAAVGMLSAGQLADLGPGERIVYSTNPTKMQRPLPGDLSKVLRRYVAEQTLYLKALKPVTENSGWENSMSPLMALTKPEMPAGLLLATAHSPYNPSLTVEVMLVGSDGKFIAEGNTLLDLDPPKSPASPIKTGKVALSPDAQRFYDAIQQLNKGKTFIDDPMLLGEMEYPEKHDPLSFIAADGLFDLGEGSNLIACIPDDGLAEPTFTCMDPEGKLDLAKYSEWLQSKCVVKNGSGWLTATLIQPIRTRQLRVDREVVGPFFRQARRNGGASLDGILTMLTKMPLNYMETITPYLAFFLLPDLNSAVDDRNIELLRVLARLDASQRKSVLAGDPLLAGRMHADSRADLNHLIYRADSPISIMTSGPPTEGVFRGSLATEVTSALPNGVPDNAVYTVTTDSQDVVIADGGDNPTSNYRPMNAGALGFLLSEGETADPNDPRQKVRLEKFRFGHTKRYQFNLQVTKNMSLDGELNENSIPRDKPSIPYEQLPQAFRDAVQKTLVEARRNRPKVPAGGKTPPPL